ncbi:MAG TPA: hypothetical protein VGC58_01515 [Candidatus Paceibacterota bacterium]
MSQVIMTMKQVPLKREHKKTGDTISVVSTELCIYPGLRVQLEDSKTVIFNHEEVEAFPCEMDIGTFYILEKDLGYNPSFNYGNLYHFEEMRVPKIRH